MKDNIKKLKLSKKFRIVLAGVAIISCSIIFDKINIPGGNILSVIGLITLIVGVVLFNKELHKKQ